MGCKTKKEKEVTRVIVSDTGPLLHLSEAGAVHLLALTGEVLIPAFVAVEYEANAQGWQPPQWVKIVDLEKLTLQKVNKWIKENRIDAGESHAIGLVLQEQAQWFVTDDAKARQFAESLGIEVHGSIGILLWNIVEGNISDEGLAYQLLDNLYNSSLWMSERVLQQAKKAIKELFE